MKKRMLLALLASKALWAQAVCPSWPMGERFALNGAEVTDKRTGLVWARCSVGQSWNGSTCTGSVSSLTHEAALQHAAGQGSWRLPSVKELASLADRGCSYPAIDVTAFPGAPSVKYWSSSPHVGFFDSAWVVSFDIGSARNNSRNEYEAVRLVRESQ
jgi:hypothetical protein